MTIKALTIENFKGIREPVRVEFKPITLLFGPNSAGKSTIVQALHYVREILERNNVDADRTAGADESLDLGGFSNLVHNHDLNLPIRLKFELSFSPLADYTDIFTKAVDNAWIEVEIKWSNFLNSPLVTSTSVGLDGEYFAKLVCAEDGKRARIIDLSGKHHLYDKIETDETFDDVKMPNLFVLIFAAIKKAFIFSKNDEINLELFVDQQSALPRHIKLSDEMKNDDLIEQVDSEVETETGEEWSSWERLNDFFQIYFGDITSILRDNLRIFRYVGPIRKIPPRFFTPVRTEEEARWTSGLAAWDVLHKVDDEFIQKTNQWLANENRLNAGYRLEIKRFKELDIHGPSYFAIRDATYYENEEVIEEELAKLPTKSRVFLREENTGLEVLPQDVGIGISQVLPVIVVALHSNSGIVAIEQPELHIHPAFQVALGDLFISQVKEQDVCFLLETHSEHLLLRMLRRIRETNEDDLPVDAPAFSPDLLAVNFVEQTDNGMSITALKVDESGEFTNKWPRGFFPERAEELF